MALSLMMLRKKTVSALTAKTKYDHKYYLANGGSIEYSLSPGSSIVNLIDRLTTDYYSFHRPNVEVFAWIMPYVMSCMMKQNYITPNGGSITVQTAFGPVSVISNRDLEWPVFVGSEEELKDNSFSIHMEEILCA